jgi:hypothetical protein
MSHLDSNEFTIPVTLPLKREKESLVVSNTILILYQTKIIISNTHYTEQIIHGLSQNDIQRPKNHRMLYPM